MKKRLKRLYAPYVKDGRRWYRAGYQEKMPDGIFVRKVIYPALFKADAVSRYQNWLLGAFDAKEIRGLRPIPLNSIEYAVHPYEDYIMEGKNENA